MCLSTAVEAEGAGTEGHSLRNQKSERGTGLAQSEDDVSPNEIGPVCTLTGTLMNTCQKDKHPKIKKRHEQEELR